MPTLLRDYLTGGLAQEFRLRYFYDKRAFSMVGASVKVGAEQTGPRIAFSVILVVQVLLLPACSFRSVTVPSINNHGGLTTFTTSEDVENALIKPFGSSAQFCAGRESDAVSVEQQGLSLGIGVSGSSENIGATSGGGALSLGGRDPLVLITREFMYRACEFSLNHNLNKDQSLDVYKLFLEKVFDIAPSVTNRGTKSERIAINPEPARESSRKSRKDKIDEDDDEDVDFDF